MGRPRARSLPARSEAASSAAEPRLGQKVSILYRLEHDPQFPFNEVVGVLQRIEVSPEGETTSYLVVKRDGSLVSVPATAIVRLKVVPTGRGPVRIPSSWEREQS